MSAPSDPSASARRMAIWAAFLVLPLVLGAAFLPGLVRSLRSGAPAQAAQAAQAAAAAQANAASAAAVDGPQAAPRPPPGPTPEQIEAAREAQVDLAKAQAGWKKAQSFAPRAPERDASGDLLSPFEGFGLDVETAPPDAQVSVNGRALGQTPLLASVPCRPGEALELTLSRPGYQVHRQPLRCRADALQHLSVPLKRKVP